MCGNNKIYFFQKKKIDATIVICKSEISDITLRNQKIMRGGSWCNLTMMTS